MTSTEYKKEWNKLKKELMKDGDPMGLKGCMYMTAQQIVNHTATVDLGWAGEREEAESKAEGIKATTAWKRFAEAIGVKATRLEEKENAYYIRHLYMRICY